MTTPPRIPQSTRSSSPPNFAGPHCILWAEGIVSELIRVWSFPFFSPPADINGCSFWARSTAGFGNCIAYTPSPLRRFILQPIVAFISPHPLPLPIHHRWNTRFGRAPFLSVRVRPPTPADLVLSLPSPWEEGLSGSAPDRPSRRDLLVVGGRSSLLMHIRIFDPFSRTRLLFRYTEHPQ